MQEPFAGARPFLRMLLNLETIMGVAVFIVITSHYYTLSNFLGEKEQNVLLGQFFHFHLLALVTVFVFGASNYLWNRLWELPMMNNHIRTIINLWLCINTLIFLCGLGTLWSLVQCVDETIKMADTSLYMGIDEYFESPTWKLRWDEIQYRQQCCGVNSYKDWLGAIWLPSNCVSNEFVFTWSKTYAPYSCCSRDNPDCYKKYVPDPEGNIPILSISNLNVNGCLPIFLSILWKLIYILCFLLVFALLLQLCIWVFVRYIISNQCGIGHAENMDSVKIASILSDLGGLGSSESCTCFKNRSGPA